MLAALADGGCAAACTGILLCLSSVLVLGAGLGDCTVQFPHISKQQGKARASDPQYLSMCVRWGYGALDCIALDDLVPCGCDSRERAPSLRNILKVFCRACSRAEFCLSGSIPTTWHLQAYCQLCPTCNRFTVTWYAAFKEGLHSAMCVPC